MIRSLAVILIPLVIITVLFTDLPNDHPVTEVDWTPVLTTAREQAPVPGAGPDQSAGRVAGHPGELGQGGRTGAQWRSPRCATSGSSAS